MRRAASFAASRTSRSVLLLVLFERVLSVLLARSPARLAVRSPPVFEPRLSREALLLLPVVPDEVPSSAGVDSVEVVSVLLFPSVVAVELALPLLLLLAFFFEQPATVRAKTTPKAIINSLLFIADSSPYRAGVFNTRSSTQLIKSLTGRPILPETALRARRKAKAATMK